MNPFNGVPAEAAAANRIRSRRFTSYLVVVFFLLVLGIAASGFFYYTRQEWQIKQGFKDQLAAVGDLRVDQITSWRRERISDAELFHANEPFALLVQQLTRHPSDAGLKRSLQYWLMPVKQSHDYKAIILLDVQCNILFQLSDSQRELRAGARKLVKMALDTRAIQLSDLHQGDSALGVHLDMVVPLFSTSKRETLSVGSLLFQIDPQNYLFPMINQWPTPSRTAETILLRREGEEILYLNELRHRPNTALTFKLSVHDSLLPAAKAARGEEGVVEGVDYRGIPVLADLRKIPRTPWFLVAKIDLEEINAPIRQQAWYVVALVAALLLAGFGGITSIWNRQHVDQLQVQGQISKSLKQSEALFKLFYENVRDAFATVDMDGHILEFNDEFARMLGYRRDEIRSLTYQNITPKQWHEFETNIIKEQVIQRGYSDVYEKEYEAKDGTIVPVELRTVMITDQNSQPNGMWAIVRDITNRKQMEKRLSESEARFRLLFDEAPAGYHEIDKEGRVVEVNRTELEMLGYTRSEMIGRPIWEFVSDSRSSREAVIAKIAGIMPSDQAFERRICKRDGTIRDVLVKDRMVRNEVGEITGIRSTVQDNTERKRAEEALRESENRLRLFFSQSLDGFYFSLLDEPKVWDDHVDKEEVLDYVFSHQRITEINDAMLLQYGATRESFVGRPLSSFFRHDSENARRLRKQLFDEGHLRIETSELKEDGTPIWIEGDYICMYDEQHRIVGTFGIQRDITERKRVEVALQNSEAQYRLMFSHNPQPMLVFDKETLAFLEVNDAIIAHYGYSRDEFLQMTIKDIRPPEDIPTMMEAVTRQAEPYHNVGTFRHRKKNGTLIDVEITRHDIRFNNGDAVLVRVNDITDRKRAEEALRASEEKHRAVVDQAAEGIAIAQDRVIKFSNSSLAKLLGYRLEEIEGKEFVKMIPPGNREVILERYSQRLAGDHIPAAYESSLLHKDGRVVPVDITASVIQYEGKPADLVIVRDATEHKQAEAAIRVSEERLNFALVMSGIGSWELDLQDHSAHRSLQHDRIFGYKTLLPAWTYEIFLDHVLPEDRAEVDRLFKVAIAEKGEWDFECRIRRCDGQVRWIWASGRHLFDEEGEAHRMSGIVQDISERKQAEKAVRDSEELYRTLVSASPDAITVIDVNGIITFTSANALKLFGHASIDEVLGHNVLDWVAPESIEKAVDNLQYVIATGQPRDLEYVLQKADNTRFIGELNAGVLRGLDNKPRGVVIITRDITARKRIEDELRASEERYRFLVEHSPDGIAIHCDGKIVFVNAEAVRLLRATSPEQVIGMTMIDLIHPDYRAIVKERSRAAMEGKALPSIEEKLLCLDGSTVDVELATIPFTYEGRPAVQAVARDITERKRVERALQESEEKFKTLFNSASDAIFTMDHTSFLDCNATTEKIFRCSRDQIIGHSPANFSPERQPDGSLSSASATEKIEAAFAGEPQSFEWVHTHLDGTPFSAEVSLNRVLIGGGFILQAIVRDISERKLRDQKITLLAQAVASIKDCVSITDLEDRFIFVNEAFRDTYGYSAAEILGKDTSILKSSTISKETADQIFASTLAGGWYGEIMNIRKDGTNFPVELWTSAVKDKTGKPVAMVGVARDVTERRRTERELRESEGRYRAVLTSATDAIITVDTNGNIVGWNKGSERIFGYRYTEAVGQPVTRLVPQHWREKHVFGFTRHQTGAESHVMGKTVEMDGLRKDGSEFPLELSLSEWEVDEGRFYTGIIRDITERKRVEEALHYHEGLLRETGKIAQVGGWEFDPTTGQGTWTEEVARIHDLDKDAETSVAFALTYYEGEHRAKIETAVREAIGLAKPYDLELQLTTAKGDHKWVRTIGHPVVENGRVVKVVGSFQDITKQRETGEHIQRLYVAIEQSGEIIFMTDTKGIITYVNPAFERTYGYTPEESVGKTPRILKSGLLTNDDYKKFWDIITTGKSLRNHLTNKTKGGKFIIVDSSVNPVRTSFGEVLGFIAVQRDITDQQKAQQERTNLERQLFQAQKIESLGTLAGGIAHDFNNILAIILGHSSLLRRPALDAEKLAKSIQAIETATQRGASLVRQILTFARKADVLFEPISLNDSVAELVKLIEETFPRTVVVAMDLDRTLPSIEADRTQIHQTLLNLCVNARDAMPDGGTISIRTTRANLDEMRARIPDVRQGSFICVSVTDTGTGMDEETKRRIFEPFFTTKAIGKGTGLGLSLVHGIVENHNGHVDVESSPGAGTSFHLYFPVPVHENEATGRTDLQDEDCPGGNETLLLVEDEEALRELLQSLLETKGYKVLMAVDGESAVKLYTKNHKSIAAVITDFGLPKLDGGKVFLRMKQIHPDVKVILASGYFDPAMKSELTTAGVRGFIQKPYLPNIVLKQVRSVLDS